MLKRIVKYVFSGGMGFLINLTLFWLLTTYLGVWYVTASVIAFILSTFAGFALHKHVTYSDTSRTTHKKVVAYYILNISNVIVNAGLIYAFVDYMYIPKLAALILSSGLISIYSYVIYQKYIFK